MVFAGFNSTDCGMSSVAVRNNPTQIDYVPSIHMQDITWVRTPSQARFYLGPNDVVSEGEYEATAGHL